MITRGAFIGEIIDELSTIAEQVKLRNTMGYTDLSVFAENFYRDILNVLLNVKLQNLNTDRSNEPGLDLGDRRSRIAFQVTASACCRSLGIDQRAHRTSEQHLVGKSPIDQQLSSALAGHRHLRITAAK